MGYAPAMALLVKGYLPVSIHWHVGDWIGIGMIDQLPSPLHPCTTLCLLECCIRLSLYLPHDLQAC